VKKPRGKSGKKLGRPRKSDFDGIEDMPPVKRSTKPSRTTLDIIARIRLAHRYLRPHARIADAANAYLHEHFTEGGGPRGKTRENLERVERWLRDPARSAPPTPENARKQRVSGKKAVISKP
jgi:hypothetical protein